MCHSEFSKLFVLSVVIELWEAAEVEARRVGDSSLAGVEFSLVEPLNHELPQENKTAGGTKQRKRKKTGGVRSIIIPERIVQEKQSQD